MARIFVTLLSAATMLFFGIVSLSYANQDLQGQGLANQNAEAVNLTRDVGTNLTTVMGHSMPWLFIIVILVVLTGMFLLLRR